MALKVTNVNAIDKSRTENIFGSLDRGIDDMENGRELPLEDAFLKIEELRNARRVSRV